MVDRGRPRLALGTYGDVSCAETKTSTKRKPRYKARARFRESDGSTVTVARYGQTKDAAKRRLREHLADRQRDVASSVIQSGSTVTELADIWLAAGHDWAVNTAETYESVVKKHVKTRLGSVLLRELRPAKVSAALTAIRDDAGPGAAKTTKTALAGMFDYAVAQDAMHANPARVKVKMTRAKKTVRALTRDEVTDMCDRLRADKRAIGWDLPDLVEWMLGTGARIGEACAARPAVVDVAAGTWEINATLIRIKGARRRKTLEAKTERTWEEDEELTALRTLAPGLHIQERPKTAAGWRVLALPPYCVDLINRRRGELHLADELGVLFGAPKAKSLRDPSNTAGDLRTVLDSLGYEWVTSHVFRKTVATRLDDAGMSAKQVADQLGHAKPSMTLDVYMGRKVVSAEAARILER